ncbi:TetR/AcrR family transcriptional regulator [Tsukamurella sp. 8F]|uniref:TetR/AcrR family transcriptional regulator n=1 Tax=unclassified Tsukamurella TaxID=2633480 RepID=UPI0023BA231B|nr:MULTISPECIES: TetR/AcrR family transcriptional regulator [unclassified Tsukamurella]MDF0528830.1 TetR/AcrR family transcriptional regulator [Tsukamurella sp. 8J]MDF0586665.1 TetR/AcrR family transcriptional regulator [Tsukamurella sp. 8F]
MSLRGEPTRRRGAELELALLDAAFEELREKGYDAFTIDAVAQRAHTSRAVLYRRWSSKPDLVTAAIAHGRDRSPVAAPDTGTLRGDLLALFEETNRTRAQLGIMMGSRLGAYYAETGTSFADLRETVLKGGGFAVDEILTRAVERGEIDPTRLTPRVRSVPFDLYRHELLMTLRPVSPDVAASIVDEVFLPLVLVTAPAHSRRGNGHDQGGEGAVVGGSDGDGRAPDT